jgi:hypothetical protein
LVLARAVYVATLSDHHEVVHGDIPVMSMSSEAIRTIEIVGLFFLGAILLGVGAGASKSSAPQGHSRPQFPWLRRLLESANPSSGVFGSSI